jgi:hypothetical protein
VTGTVLTPQGSTRGWSRMAAEDRWTEVLLRRDCGTRITRAVLDAFPGAVLHAIVTDVLGPNEASIETIDGRHLRVRLDNAFRVTGWRMTDGGQKHKVVSIAA